MPIRSVTKNKPSVLAAAALFSGRCKSQVMFFVASEALTPKRAVINLNVPALITADEEAIASSNKPSAKLILVNK